MARHQRRRSSDQRRPRPAGSGPALVGGGALLAILAVWFAWQLTGTLTPVRDGAPSWHPDGDRLVFYSELPMEGEPTRFQSDLFTMNLDGTNRVNLTNTPRVTEGAPAWSPDGTRLAFDADVGGNLDIYIRDMERPGSGDRRVTTDAARDVAAAWHPAGDRLLFMSDRVDPGRRFDVFEIDLSAEDARPIRLTGDGGGWFPQYSHDGDQIAMHVGRDVHLFTPESGLLRRLTTVPADGMYPSWSPDDEQLVFMTRRNNRQELFTMGRDGSNQQRLLSMPTGGAIDPRISPDGQFVAFVHVPEATEHEAQTGQESRVIYVIELETGRVRRVSP